MITTFFVVTACKLMAIKSYAALNNYDLQTLYTLKLCWL